MSRKKRRKRYRGHYCWCCGRIRPNEEFSGKGHARHLCRECARLGPEELEYRSALWNLDRCIDCGLIRRKRRKEFDRYLEHKNPRVRELAQKLLAEDARLRAEWREERRLEEELEEQWLAGCEADQQRDESEDAAATDPHWADTEIPF
jgi:hypothetical protein